MIKILFLGEIIGIPTVKKIEIKLRKIIEDNKINIVIANADGASDGYGILKKTAYDLFNSGINIITGGDFIFNKKDVRDLLKAPFMLKPYNLPNALGGKGISIYNFNNIKIGIINILGRININKIFASDPFYSIDKALEKIDQSVKTIIVDFHGGTTSEIQAMHWHLSGRVSLVVGSHLKVLTSDNRIINNRTGIISGIGFCGTYYSIGGLKIDNEIKKVRYGQFLYSQIEKETIVELQGIVSDFDENTGECKSIDLFKEKI